MPLALLIALQVHRRLVKLTLRRVETRSTRPVLNGVTKQVQCIPCIVRVDPLGGQVQLLAGANFRVGTHGTLLRHEAVLPLKAKHAQRHVAL